MHEYELEAEFLRVTMGGGLRHTGYPSIVAAGKNAATLHYDQNSAAVGTDELVLVDAGAEFRCKPCDNRSTWLLVSCPPDGKCPVQCSGQCTILYAIWPVPMRSFTSLLLMIGCGADRQL